MLKQYPRFKSGEAKEIFNTFSSKQKAVIEEYVQYRAAMGLKSKDRLEDTRRHCVSWFYIYEDDFNKFSLRDLHEYLALLNHSSLEENYKNEIKVNLKNFLKWNFKDYSSRFGELRELRVKQKKNERKINSSTVLNEADIKQIMKAETRIFWKTFFISLYESGTRPIELRLLRWKDITFNVQEEISEFNVYATKTSRARTVFVKESTFYLKQLQDEQHKLGVKSVYVFPSPVDPNRPLSKSGVSEWLRELSQRALGREIFPYILRHSRATELYRLAKENKIAKDTAIEFMGHSEDMSDVYTHLDKETTKQIISKQVYMLEDLPPERKHELELKIEKLEDVQGKMMKFIGILMEEKTTGKMDGQKLVDLYNSMGGKAKIIEGKKIKK